MKNSRQVTAEQVARLAGVSISAVSRTFTEGASVSEDMRKKVLAAADELGYRVNFLARSFHKQKIPLVGVVVSRLDTPFRSKLLADLIHVVQTAGLNVMVCETGKGSNEKDVFGQFLQYRVSGVIILSGTPSETIINDCAHQGIPAVAINRETSLDVVDQIISDNNSGGHMAAELLIKAGAKQLTFINREGSTFSGIKRGSAFLQAVADKVVAGGLSFNSCNAHADDMESGYALARTLFASATPPDAIFTASDLLACGIIEGARSHHQLTAGEDYSIIGFDNIDTAGWPSFQLSTFQQDTLALARQAMTRLQERIQDPHKQKTTDIIPVQFINRATIIGSRHASA